MRAFYPFFLLALYAACSPMQNSSGFDKNDAPGAWIIQNGSLTVDKMNVFYIGVDNPISVLVPGVRSDKVELSIENGTLTKDPVLSSHYNVRVSRPGEVTITLKAADAESSIRQTFYFRAKRIPDPTPSLDWPSKYEYAAEIFRQKKGMFMILNNFDFDARCQVVGYTLTRIARNGDRQTAATRGERFDEAAQKLVDQAENGDVFIFSEIKTLCPGDESERQLNNVAFFIQ